MHLTLVRPGFDVADRTNGAINLDYAGGGMVLCSIGADSPNPHHFESAREAKEFIILYASDLIADGYQLSTGE